MVPVYEMRTVRTQEHFFRQVLLKPLKNFGHRKRISIVGKIDPAVIAAAFYADDIMQWYCYRAFTGADGYAWR
jgi:hypothetical protein